MPILVALYLIIFSTLTDSAEARLNNTIENNINWKSPGDPITKTTATWITHKEAIRTDQQKQPISLQFRMDWNVETVPGKVPVRISADQRFILFINGQRVATGPSRGDLAHWRYEALDLAPWLRKGDNIIAAQVWSDGVNAPGAQISSGHTGFWLQSEMSTQSILNTGRSWRVRVDRSRVPYSGKEQLSSELGPTMYMAGAPEKLVGTEQLPDWNTKLLGYTSDSGDWQSAVPAVQTPTRELVVDTLPQMRFNRVPTGRVVRSSGVDAAPFPQRSITVPSNTKATILLDAGRVLAAYPVLHTDGGTGAVIKMTYVESLYDKSKLRKSAPLGQERLVDRASVTGGIALGLTDTIMPSSGRARFEPFWWRAWRYLQIDVQTASQPLSLEGLETYETGYPFTQEGHFISNDRELNEIWHIGWNTALLDAHETYMDTAYWEQLQYIGDSRIQALISYGISGDTRLAKQAIDAFNASRLVNGLPLASWPQQGRNSIPPFALLWIGMLHDYWMRYPDTEVLRRNLTGMRLVLDWYKPWLRAEGTLRSTPGWLFVDWAKGLDGADRSGRAPDSCPITLLYIGALREAADIERAIGDPKIASKNSRLAERASAGVQAQCWDPKRQLYADTPEKKSFSQHANLLAVLYDVAPRSEQQAILHRVIEPSGIGAPEGVTGTSYYFSFYLGRALAHAGMTEQYSSILTPWRNMLKQHFTAWPENPPPSRSDSHAWSAHPTIGLIEYIAGIQSDAPGFKRVLIAPNLGNLTFLDAAQTHPAGNVHVKYKVMNKKIIAEISLPHGISGRFVMGARQWELKDGYNILLITP
ncbi:alpha-L-rhamnosidase-related protein [Pantoea dispersa]|uniref:alpha-L-rhamnosidase-related protein n=1 Tax=Pantoea dispersa TaxID=59814 RepID=UPI001CA6E03B|nr:alpha-L-rhamnosidase C-terminal domain-containing protein [Pantoea dispersa]QZY97700.1 hypothetical protein K7X52_23535 [Pantoea dispersa]